MAGKVSDILQAGLRQFGLQLVRHDTIQKLRENQHAKRQLDFLKAMPIGHRARLVDLLAYSRSEYLQDLFALSVTGFKPDGYFVEFGATDGVSGSNSLLLEERFNWRGVLAEPARVWHAALRKNRKSFVETNCVWRESGLELEFREPTIGALSTLNDFTRSDSYGDIRSGGIRYRVRTISLMDLLAKHGAPTEIDFLSIDTEGSELDILAAFDFSRYRFNVIVCEHNFTDKREKIHDVLTAAGYTRVHEDLSAVDDWYVNAGTAGTSQALP